MESQARSLTIVSGMVADSAAREATTHALTDERLIESYKNGDSRSFDVLVNRYRKRIFLLCLRKTQDPAESEDLTQEVLTRLHRGMTSYQPTSSFYTWVYRITANICIDHFRRRKCRLNEQAIQPEVGMDQIIPDETGDISHRPLDPGDTLLRRELKRVVHRAISGLTPKLRDVLTLRDLQGHSYSEIAEMLGSDPIKVKTRLFRARKQLRAALTPYVSRGELRGLPAIREYGPHSALVA